MSEFILITTCVSSKTLPTPTPLKFRNTPTSINPLGWLEQLKLSPTPNKTALDLYKGKLWSIPQSLLESKVIEDLYIISAGYGFIHHQDYIRPYSISFRQNSFDSTLSRGFSSTEWWETLDSRKKLINFILNNPTKKIILYGSQPYIAALTPHLKSLPDNCKNLFLFAPDVKLKALDRFLVKPPFTMRYIVGGNKITTTMKCIEYSLKNIPSNLWDISYLNEYFTSLTKNYSEKEYKKILERKPDEFIINLISSSNKFNKDTSYKNILYYIREQGYAIGENRLCRLLENIFHK